MTAFPIAPSGPLGPKAPDRVASPTAPPGPLGPIGGTEELTRLTKPHGLGSANGKSPWLARFRDGGSKPPPVLAASDDGDALESAGVVLDGAGDPAMPCATCRGRCFH